MRPSEESSPAGGIQQTPTTRCGRGGRVQSSRVRSQLHPAAGGSGSPFSYTALPYARPMIVLPPQALGIQRQLTGLRGGRVLRSSRNSIPPPSLVQVTFNCIPGTDRLIPARPSRAIVFLSVMNTAVNIMSTSTLWLNQSLFVFVTLLCVPVQQYACVRYRVLCEFVCVIWDYLHINQQGWELNVEHVIIEYNYVINIVYVSLILVCIYIFYIPLNWS